MAKEIKIKKGEKFGFLTVIKEVAPNIIPSGQINRRVLCKCDCGEMSKKQIGNLKNGKSTHCGCKKKIEIKKGDRYGRLIIMKEIFDSSYRMFKCLCDCGKLTIVSRNHLRNGHTTSCGCKKQEKKHGMCNTKTYIAWAGMIQRCINPKSIRFEAYGGRGILVCQRWKDSFENFLEDMGEVPTEMSLDRVNNNGNYYKENCRWAGNKDQARNKRTNRLISMNGKTQPVICWAEELNMNASTIGTRLFKKWDPVRALTEPIRYT